MNKMDLPLLLFDGSFKNMSAFTIAFVFLTSSLYYGFHKEDQPRFKVNPPWQVKKVYVFNGYDNKIRDHTRTIQLWLHNSGLKNLPVFKSQPEKNLNRQDFCRSIVMQLLDPSRSENLNHMLHLLHTGNQEGQNLAEALAYVILVALKMSTVYRDTIETFEMILCQSNDSFVFNYILSCLDQPDNILTVKLNQHTEFDQHTSFLQSPAPFKKNYIYALFSKLPLIKSLLVPYDIFKKADLTPVIFQGFVSQLERETDFIRTEFLKNPSLIQDSDPINFEVTPINISYTNMRSYKRHYTTLQTQLEKHKSSLDLFKKLQDSKSFASSPLISNHFVKIKQIYQSAFQFFRKEEHILLGYEKAYVITRLCSRDFIRTQDMWVEFSALLKTGREKFIERKELDHLNDVVSKNMALILNLEKAFELSGNGISFKFKPLLQSCIDDTKKECEMYVGMYNEINDAWTSLQREISSIETSCKEKTESIPVFTETLSKFGVFIHDRGMELLEGFVTHTVPDMNESNQQVLTQMVIQTMVDFVVQQ